MISAEITLLEQRQCLFYSFWKKQNSYLCLIYYGEQLSLSAPCSQSELLKNTSNTVPSQLQDEKFYFNNISQQSWIRSETKQTQGSPIPPQFLMLWFKILIKKYIKVLPYEVCLHVRFFITTYIFDWMKLTQHKQDKHNFVN